MRLRQLFEAHHKATAAFCFGRFNPAHQGHAKVWEAVAHAGQHWYIGTNPTTIGPNDPLPFDVKRAWMTAIDPHVKGHIIGEKSVVTLASKIYETVGDNATVAYITDAQDWAWSGKLLHDYNGKEGPHGYYNFAKIVHIESPRVTSATDLRNAARAGDEETFYRLAGVDPQLTIRGKTYFETVAEACGHHPEKVKRAKKEKDLNLIKETNQKIRERKRAVAEGARAHGSFIGIGADVDAALPGVWVQRQLRNTDPYMQYLYGLALAAARAEATGDVSFEQESGWAENLTIVGYTPEDEELIKMADKLMGVKATQVADHKSREAKGTMTQSPVAKSKRNKYGI
jgi:hypothetical protein